MGQILLVILIPVLLYLLGRSWAGLILDVRSTRRRIPRFSTGFDTWQPKWTTTRRWYAQQDHKQWEKLFRQLEK